MSCCDDDNSDKQQVNQQPQQKLQSYSDHKAKMMPLIRYLKKRGLKFKHANVQNIRVQYFRMDMLQQLLEKNAKQISQDNKLTQLIDRMKDDLNYFRRPPNSQKRRFPHILQHIQSGKKGKFASFKFDTTQSKKWLLYTVVFGLIAMVLFPLWPYQVKYGAWIISFSFLCLLLAIIFIRIVIYLIFAIFGMSLWVFPNLFGDKGPIDSFKPLYSVQRWDKDYISMIGRLIAFSLLAYYGISIYRDPDFYLQNIQSTKKAMEDFHDWGVDKIKGETNFSQRAITVQKILNDTKQAYENDTEQGNEQM